MVALDPETGIERWRFDPGIDVAQPRADLACRGVSTWSEPTAAPAASCARRVFLGTVDGRLFALDAKSGRRCDGFGANGEINLTQGVGSVQPGRYGVTSPPAVVGDVLVVGSAIGDNSRTDDACGTVRAFDTRTGALRWSWDPIPRGPSDPAWSTWENDSAARTGAANAWSIISADPERDLVFIPTGSASPDFYGGERLGDDLYANANPGREISPQTGTPYAMRRDFDALLSPLGIPCNPPPWGTLSAVDVATGAIRWQVTLGTTRDLSPVPIGIRWGTPSMGGPIVTGGGLVFIAAAMDNYLRAFDLHTGEELWAGRLPAGGQATPMTYRVREDGKQFVVIAAGGHARMGTTLGDFIVAFALP